MKPLLHHALEPDIPPVSRRHESWTTWMWLGFALCVAIATIVGFWYATTPYMLQ